MDRLTLRIKHGFLQGNEYFSAHRDPLQNIISLLMRPIAAALLTLATVVSAQSGRLDPTKLVSSDILRLRFVGDAQLSPDGRQIVYTVISNDGPGRPPADLWITNVADGKTRRFCPAGIRCAGATWSPNEEWIAFHGATGGRAVGGKPGLHVAHPNGTSDLFIAEVAGTNNPLP